MRAAFPARLRALRGDRRGVALTEFALALPVLLTLYLSTFALSDAISCSRKVTVTARALTDLATRYSSLKQADVDTILSASAQVMSPYPTGNAVIGLSEVQIVDATHAKVIWSKARGGAGLAVGSQVIVPANMAAKDTYLILGQARYTYTPAVGFVPIDPIVFADSILMLPRISDQVPLS